MTRTEFEKLVAEALDDLPAYFARAMNNVAIVVEDTPTREQLQRTHVPRGGMLLGLYEGVPLTGRTTSYGMIQPDVIYIFQRPIEAMCWTDAEIRKQVRSTVIHEIAHHFGISDERLEELGVS